MKELRCLNCGSDKVIRKGVRGDKQRLLCKDCGKRFHIPLAELEKYNPKVYINYIGKGVYTKRSFKAEAKRIGVNRAVAPYMLGFIRPDDIILTAFHKVNRKTNKKSAEVFGFFVVRGISINEELAQLLEAEGMIEIHYTKPTAIIRGCGSYTQAGFYTLSDDVSMDDIFDKVAELGKDMKIGNVFLSGEFYELDNELVIKNIDHTRGYLKVTEDIPEYEEIMTAVKERLEKAERKDLVKKLNAIIRNYKRVVMRKKGEKKAYV